MKTLLASTALALGLAGPVAAAPMLTLDVYDNGTLVAGTPITSSTGTLSFNGSATGFSVINVDVSGVPLIPSPELGTVTLDTRSLSAGTRTLEVLVTQSGLPSFAGGTGETTSTVNGLIGAPGPTTVKMVFNGTTIANHLFPASSIVATDTQLSTLAAVTGPFSEEQEISAVFTGANQQLESTVQFDTVPEPWAIALFGVGLLGLAMIRRRRPLSLG